MFAVMPVTPVPPRRPAWKRPEYGPPATEEKQENALPVIDLEPLPVDEAADLPPAAAAPRRAAFPTGLIVDIRA
jgi:hypothetical protein